MVAAAPRKTCTSSNGRRDDPAALGGGRVGGSAILDGITTTPPICEVGAERDRGFVGEPLVLPTMPLTPPVTVQLKNGDVCWQATYATPRVNTATQFKSKAN